MNWIDSEVRFLNRVVKAHDRKLYCERSHLGHIKLMREAYYGFPHDVDGHVVYFLKRRDQFIFALTDDWTVGGKPVSWGSQVVLDRLQKHDAWNRSVLKELEEQDQKREESKDRARRNQNEAWAYEAHAKFKKQFSDIRTANMDKSDRRRRNFEKRMEFKEK